MATQAQINDILTCGAVAGFSGYSLKRMEAWVRFYCHPDHFDAMNFSEHARARLEAVCAERRDVRNARNRCDAERAKDIALCQIMEASRASVERDFDRTVQYNAKHQGQVRRRKAKGKPSLKILPRASDTSTARDAQQG